MGIEIMKLNKTALITAFILSIYAASATAKTSERDLPKQPELDLIKISRLIFKYTNEERKKYKLPPFTEDKTLADAAKLQSDHMVKLGYITHHGGKYYKPEDRVAAVCKTEKSACLKKYRETPKGPGRYFKCCSENVIESFALTMNGVGFYELEDKKGKYRLWDGDVKWLDEDGLAKEMVRRWMHSPPHRRNILNGRLKTIGVAVSWDGNEKYYGTQVFAPLAD